MDEGRPTVAIYLDFNKASNTVFVNIIIDKLMERRLDKWTVRQTGNWLNYLFQSAVMTGTKSIWRSAYNSLFPGVSTGSKTWTMGQSTPLARSQRIQNWDDLLMHQTVVLPVRGTPTSWRNGPAWTSWIPAKKNAKSYTWDGITPCTNKQWGMTSRKAALQRRM